MGFAAELHKRFITWALRAGAPEAMPIVLVQRRVYVLPTRAGLAYAAALAVMLTGAINYNLSLGYALVFLLGGLGVVAILHTFRNLAGLVVDIGRAEAVFTGETAVFRIVLSGKIERCAVRLWVADGNKTGTEAIVDLYAGESTEACLKLPAEQRGWLTLSRIGLETCYPLGLIRAWAYCAPDFRCLVYPRPARHAPPPPLTGGAIGSQFRDSPGSDDFHGLRGHQAADPPRHVAWKAAARREPDAPLLTKQFAGAAGLPVWLDWQALTGFDVEQRLAVLTRWALDAHAAGLSWGLRLPGVDLAPATGAEHLHAALRALALHGSQ